MKICGIIIAAILCVLYVAFLVVFRMGTLQSRIEEEELRHDR